MIIEKPRKTRKDKGIKKGRMMIISGMNEGEVFDNYQAPYGAMKYFIYNVDKPNEYLTMKYESGKPRSEKNINKNITGVKKFYEDYESGKKRKVSEKAEAHQKKMKIASAKAKAEVNAAKLNNTWEKGMYKKLMTQYLKKENK